MNRITTESAADRPAFGWQEIKSLTKNSLGKKVLKDLIPQHRSYNSKAEEAASLLYVVTCAQLCSQRCLTVKEYSL